MALRAFRGGEHGPMAGRQFGREWGTLGVSLPDPPRAMQLGPAVRIERPQAPTEQMPRQTAHCNLGPITKGALSPFCSETPGGKSWCEFRGRAHVQPRPPSEQVVEGCVWAEVHTRTMARLISRSEDYPWASFHLEKDSSARRVGG